MAGSKAANVLLEANNKKMMDTTRQLGAGSSPTVSTDGSIVTTAIDAHKGRDVATMNIPKTFLHAKTDEHIIILLR